MDEGLQVRHQGAPLGFLQPERLEQRALLPQPDPAASLSAWRKVAPAGRLALFESMWGVAADPVERARQRGRQALWRLRRTPHDHHGEYDDALRGALPLGRGTPVAALTELVETAGWGPSRLERLRDVEWASLLAIGLLDRFLGVPPRFAITAG